MLRSTYLPRWEHTMSISEQETTQPVESVMNIWLPVMCATELRCILSAQSESSPSRSKAEATCTTSVPTLRRESFFSLMTKPRARKTKTMPIIRKLTSTRTAVIMKFLK